MSMPILRHGSTRSPTELSTGVWKRWLVGNSLRNEVACEDTDHGEAGIDHGEGFSFLNARVVGCLPATWPKPREAQQDIIYSVDFSKLMFYSERLSMGLFFLVITAYFHSSGSKMVAAI